MPVQPCTANGKAGYKWGASGKCYTGPGAKVRAARQGIAAISNGYPALQAEIDELYSIIGSRGGSRKKK